VDGLQSFQHNRYAHSFFVAEFLLSILGAVPKSEAMWIPRTGLATGSTAEIFFFFFFFIFTTYFHRSNPVLSIVNVVGEFYSRALGIY
jgi:hypothetical protein